MNHRLSIFTCILVLAAVTIDALDKRESRDLPIRDEKRREFISKEGFLFGERTPVWLATNPNNGSAIVYERLRRDIMKHTMIKWRSNDEWALQPDASIDAYSIKKKKKMEKSPQGNDDVIYLTILVVMDYGGNWFRTGSAIPNGDAIDAILIYAMAFWNSVDLDLRFLEPKVRIRIAGIVIGEDRSATPYIYENLPPSGDYDAESAILSMQQYWDYLSETNKKDFLKTAYDCVVTLTELKPREPITYNLLELYVRLPVTKFKVLSIIINDDMAFFGVRGVANELIDIINELPLTESQRKAFEKLVPPYPAAPYIQYKYFLMDGKQFYDKLSKPKEHHDPGKPLDTILQGQVMTPWEQCRALKHKDVCWDHYNCGALRCLHDGGYCDTVGIFGDGYYCYKNMMCMEGKCVYAKTMGMH